VLLHYGPREPNVVHVGSMANRAVLGSPDGLPARPKHNTTHALGRPNPISYRAGPNRAGLVPAHLTRAKFSGLLRLEQGKF
jgi:hypothetical protein